MKTFKTFLKGKLTEGSLLTIIAGLVSIQAEILPAFQQGTDSPINLVILAGVLGSIWGKLRRKTEAYKAK